VSKKQKPSAPISFARQAAQGDVFLSKIESLPEDAKAIPHPKDNSVILGHSETGHHHAIAAPPSAVEVFGSSQPRLAYLRVNADFADLRHHRDFDTHTTLRIARGVYEVRQQREHTPWGDVTVQD